MFLETAAKDLADATKKALNTFWNSYKSISNLDTLEEAAFLLPFVLARFGIKHSGPNTNNR